MLCNSERRIHSTRDPLDGRQKTNIVGGLGAVLQSHGSVMSSFSRALSISPHIYRSPNDMGVSPTPMMLQAMMGLSPRRWASWIS